MEARGNDERGHDENNENTPIPSTPTQGWGELDEFVGKDWELISHDENEAGGQNEGGETERCDHHDPPVNTPIPHTLHIPREEHKKIYLINSLLSFPTQLYVYVLMLYSSHGRVKRNNGFISLLLYQTTFLYL